MAIINTWMSLTKHTSNKISMVLVKMAHLCTHRQRNEPRNTTNETALKAKKNYTSVTINNQILHTLRDKYTHAKQYENVPSN